MHGFWVYRGIIWRASIETTPSTIVCRLILLRYFVSFTLFSFQPFPFFHILHVLTPVFTPIFVRLSLCEYGVNHKGLPCDSNCVASNGCIQSGAFFTRHIGIHVPKLLINNLFPIAAWWPHFTIPLISLPHCCKWDLICFLFRRV